MTNNTSRTQKFIYNSLSAVLLQIATVIAGFIVPRVMLVSFGSEINGLVSSISQFIACFALVEAGLGHAAIYSLYKPLARKEVAKLNGILSATRRFYLLSGYVFLSLTLGLALVYPFFIKTSMLNISGVFLLVLILGCSGAIEFFTMAKYRALLTADQKSYVISLASILAISINTLVVAVLAKLGYSVVIVRFVALLSVFSRSLVLFFYVRKNYPYVDYGVAPDNLSLDKRWDAFYLRLLGAAQTGAPVMIATFYTTLKMVSVYSIFNLVMTALGSIFRVFKDGLAASFGDIIVRGETEKLQRAFQELETLYYSIISWGIGTTIPLLLPFIELYTRRISDVNYMQPLLAFLFVADCFFYHIKTPQGMLVISAGMFRETRWQTTVQGGIVVIFGLILVKPMGLEGILIASILSNIYRGIDLLFFVPKRITFMEVWPTFLKVLRAGVGTLLISFPFLIFPIHCASYSEWFFWACLVAFYGLIVTVALNLSFDRATVLRSINRLSFLVRR